MADPTYPGLEAFQSAPFKTYAEKFAYDSTKEISKTTKRGYNSVVSRMIKESRAVVTEGAAKAGMELNPWMRARLAKQLVGLDERRAHAALEYRAQLINEGLPVKKVRAAFARDVKKKLASRAATIARTEASEALASGRRVEWRVDLLRGERKPEARVIIRNESGSPCPICKPKVGQSRPLLTARGRQRVKSLKRKHAGSTKQITNKDLDSIELRKMTVGTSVKKGKPKGRRYVDGPPFHINCRCFSEIV